MKVAVLAKGRPDLERRLPAELDWFMIATDEQGRYSEADLARCADVDAFLVSMEPVNEQILAAAPNLKIVQRMGVGYETLDLEACAARGIPACNLEGVNKEAVAQHALMMIMGLAKHLPEADRLTRQTDWAGARLLTKTSFELYGKTLGIVGFGNTGSTLAGMVRGLEMTVLCHDNRPIDPALLAETGARHVDSLDELLQASDIVSIHTDLNETSRRLIGARELGLLKPGALFVCCTRGGIVDEQALADALNEGRIAGAGMDVFDPEPITPDNPLLSARNCVLSGHIAGMARESSERNLTWALDNVRGVVERGRKPRFVRNGVA